MMIAERRKLDPVKAAVCVCAMDVSDANQVLVCLDLYAHAARQAFGSLGGGGLAR